jgi:putative ABC transport system permease protein
VNLLTIPLRNARRKLLRTLLLVSVFSVGVTAVVALHYVAEAVGESFERKLARYGANIVVFPEADTLALSYGGVQLGSLSYDVRHLEQADTERRIRSIHMHDRLSAISPKLVALARVDGQAVGVIGVRMQDELALKAHWRTEHAFPKTEHELLAGSRAASSMGLAPGSTVEIGGREFRVSGVLAETGSEDDEVLFADLAALQAAMGRQGQVNLVEIAALCAGCPIDEIVAELRQALPGVDIKALSQVVGQRMYSIGFVSTLAWVVGLIILLTACAMIALSLYASVGERRKEIGLMRALGFSRAGVFAAFSFEALLLGALAAVVGYLAGCQASVEVLRALDVADSATWPFSFAHLALTLAMVGLLTVLSSALPAWKAARIEPSEAFSLV